MQRLTKNTIAHVFCKRFGGLSILSRDARTADASELEVDELMVILRQKKTDSESRAVADLLNDACTRILAFSPNPHERHFPSIFFPFHSERNACESAGIL